jgi:hypothetical protein
MILTLLGSEIGYRTRQQPANLPGSILAWFAVLWQNLSSARRLASIVYGLLSMEEAVEFGPARQ